MGLSGTLMLAQSCEAMKRYYEPGKEFISYDSPEDCIEKVRFYLMREGLRQRIAQAYADRTRGEHLWDHRFTRIFRDLGLEPTPAVANRNGPIEVSFYGQPAPAKPVWII